MTPEKLTHMANHIATFFATQPGTDQAARIAAHMNDFWDPRMRAALLAHAEKGGDGLSPLVRAAIPLLRPPA